MESGSLFLSPGPIRKVAIALRPSTLLAFHQALVQCKYRRLFSSTRCPKKRGPKGPDEALIQAIVERKSLNPRFGCPRIARIISQTFGIDVDKNIVYRVLSKRYRPAPRGTGPSWLSFLGHTKDSLLWSVDLFRCESIVLRSYWVLVVMDQFTRRPIDFAHAGPDPTMDEDLVRAEPSSNPTVGHNPRCDLVDRRREKTTPAVAVLTHRVAFDGTRRFNSSNQFWTSVNSVRSCTSSR